jgi:hypothetical protein
MRRFLTPVLALGMVAVLAGCGGDDSATSTPDTTSASAELTEAPADTTPDTAAEPTDEEPPADDSCRVEVTGDKEVSWTAPGGIMALNMEYWFSAEQKEQFGNLMGDGFYFILNCVADEGSLSFIASAEATSDDIPFGPAAYELPAATNVLGTSEDGGPISVLLTLTDSETNWGLSEPGTLEITAFDNEHIAGTFSFAATDVFANLSGSSEGDIQVAGSFNFRNPN